jgi:hypothetical protein
VRGTFLFFFKRLAGACYDDCAVMVISQVQGHAKFDDSWDKKTGYVTRSMMIAPLINEYDKNIEHRSKDAEPANKAAAVYGVIQCINKTSVNYDHNPRLTFANVADGDDEEDGARGKGKGSANTKKNKDNGGSSKDGSSTFVNLNKENNDVSPNSDREMIVVKVHYFLFSSRHVTQSNVLFFSLLHSSSFFLFLLLSPSPSLLLSSSLFFFLLRSPSPSFPPPPAPFPSIWHRWCR